MSDTTHNPHKNPLHKSEANEKSMDYELITSYIDNEIKDEGDKNKIRLLIESESNYYNRYTFEKLTKETLQKRSKRIDTPVYLYKNISKEIDAIIKNVNKSKININSNVLDSSFIQKFNPQKTNLKRNLIYSSFAFIVLIVLAFVLNNYLKQNSDANDNDLVAVSRNVFKKIESGDVKLEHQTNNAKELADSLNKDLDFKVFVPDVKDAVLMGGVCNEINGEKLAHIIHRKGNIVIYTLQASMKHVMDNKDKIVLSDGYKDNVKKGKNWFPCLKDKSRTAVIWFKDNVICSTVAQLEPQEISSLLTNYK